MTRMHPRPWRYTRPQRIGLLLFLCALGGPVFVPAQTAGAPGGSGSDDPPVELVQPLEGQRRAAAPGEVFEIAFSLPPQEPEQLSLALPQLPDGVVRAGGAVILRRGTRDLQVRVPLRATRPGRFVIEPIGVEYLIGTAAPPYETPPILLEVTDPRTGRVPFQARWTIPTSDPVQGQSIPVVLELEGLDDFVFPESLSIRAPQTGLFEEVSGLGDVVSREIAGVSLYRIPVAGFIFTPSSAGAVRLPQATISAQGVQANAPAVDLQIQPALAPDQGILNAVGDVRLQVQVEPETLGPGAIGTIRMVVEGTGNLPVLEFPELELVGLLEVDRSQRSGIVPDREGQAGYSGRRELTVRFEAAGDRPQGIVRVGRFAVLNPGSGEVTIQPPLQRAVAIQTLSGPAETDRSVPQRELLEVDRLFRPAWMPLSRIPWVYVLFLLGPVGFAATKLLSVRSAAALALLPLFMGSALMPGLSRDRLERAAAIAGEGRPAVAATLYDLELQAHPWHAGLHYNRGVLALRADNLVDATYHLRSAVRGSPERRTFRDTLQAAEEYFATTDQPSIAWYLRSDLIVLALLVLWSGFWAILALRAALRRTIALISLGMIALILGGGLGWSGWHEGIAEAVVLDEAIVRRIPDLSAQPWLQLEPATAVSVELRFEGFYLVRTTAGVAGWVNEAALWMLDS